MTISNEVCADFKLNGTSVSQFSIENSIITLGTDGILELDMDAMASDIQTNSEQGFRLAQLLLTITCKITVPDLPAAKTNLVLSMEGEFESSLKMDEETFRAMLWMNGTATLYAIARGKLEAMSSLVYHSGKITLPMINVVEFFKQKQQEKQPAPVSSDPKSAT